MFFMKKLVIIIGAFFLSLLFLTGCGSGSSSSSSSSATSGVDLGSVGEISSVK